MLLLYKKEHFYGALKRKNNKNNINSKNHNYNKFYKIIYKLLTNNPYF